MMNIEKTMEEASKQLGLCLKQSNMKLFQPFVMGKDILISLPIGYEKSIVYLMLPLVFDKIRGKHQFNVL